MRPTPTLEDLRAVMADGPAEAARDVPNARFSSDRAVEILSDLHSRTRWIANQTAFNAVRILVEE